MRKIIYLFSLVAAMLVATPAFAQKAKGTFEAGNGTFLLNGKPFVVLQMISEPDDRCRWQ